MKTSIMLLVSIFLSAGILVAQGTTPDEIESLIRDLGSEDFRTREAASFGLMRIGPPARTALEKALHSEDPEVQVRARRVLVEIDRMERCRPVIGLETLAKQRSRRLGLVTISRRDANLHEVLGEMGESCLLDFRTSPEVVDRKVTLECKDLPLSEALARLGLKIKERWRLLPSTWRSNVGPMMIRRNTGRFFAATVVNLTISDELWEESSLFREGVALTFQKSFGHRDCEKVQGWVLESSALTDLRGDIEWTIKRVLEADERDVPFQICHHHSPMRIFVPRKENGDFRVVLDGTLRWYACTQILFENPRNRDVKSIGDFTVTVQWPKLVVACREGIPADVLRRTVVGGEISWIPVIKKEPLAPAPARARSGRESEFFDRHRDPAWCGCSGAPSRHALAERHLKSSLAVEASGDARNYTIDEIGAIEFTFHHPFEEPFSLTSPVILEAEED